MSDTGRNPLLSVIIPTRNRASMLAGVLDSLGALGPAQFDWEVVVVDNASEDNTRGVALKKSEELSIRIRYAFEPELGLIRGRHRGAREARGAYLAYLDDDVIVQPGWLDGVELLVKGRAEAVVGRILPRWEANPPRWLTSMPTCMNNLSLLDMGNSPKPVHPDYVIGCNCFIGKSTLFELGGFHPDGVPKGLVRYRGDGETGLMRLLSERGMRSLYDPRATVWHIIDRGRMTLDYQIKRAFNQGVSKSFTDIRETHGLYCAQTSSNDGRAIEAGPRRFTQKSVREIVDSLLLRTRVLRASLNYAIYSEKLRKIEEAKRAGWEYHQAEVRNDPSLLEYVLKESYID